MNNDFAFTKLDTSGVHNADPKKTTERLMKSRSYKDLSTVCIAPNDGLIPAKVAESWLQQAASMNQKFIRLMAIGAEKYNAFNAAIENILGNPSLSKFKYLLTLEENAILPFDGLIKLFEGMDKFDVVGGLMWTKGEEGHPMIYGYPQMIPHTFTPFYPVPEGIQECSAVGTGFTLFKLDIFKNKKVPKPWFRVTKGTSSPKITEDPDMYFFENIRKLGYKVTCDCRVRVGNYDKETEIVW